MQAYFLSVFDKTQGRQKLRVVSKLRPKMIQNSGFPESCMSNDSIIMLQLHPIESRSIYLESQTAAKNQMFNSERSYCS